MNKTPGLPFPRNVIELPQEITIISEKGLDLALKARHGGNGVKYTAAGQSPKAADVGLGAQES